MTQAIPQRPGAFVLTLFAQVLIGVLAVFCILNFFNVGNLLIYANTFLGEKSRPAKAIAILANADLLLSAAAFIFAVVRLHSPTFSGAILAQVAAIANAFLILFLWLFNAFAIAVGGMYEVPRPTSAIAMSVALVLANIIAAGMLSGVMRNHKESAPPSAALAA